MFGIIYNHFYAYLSMKLFYAFKLFEYSSDFNFVVK